MHKLLFTSLLLALLASCFSLGQKVTPRPPCDQDYGSPSDQLAIDNAMLHGTVDQIKAAIQTAKETRGYNLGCPQGDYGPRTEANTTPASLDSILQIWQRDYVPLVDRYEIGCPEIGRGLPSLGLAAYYARLSGHYEALEPLEAMAIMLEAQQYSEKYAPEPLAAPAGIYGYVYAQDTCALTGVAGEGTRSICERFPRLCPRYQAGLFAGQQFGIQDHVVDNGIIIGDLGGTGYDMGWAGVHMVEAALQQDNPLFKHSALLAGEWAIQMPLSRNHNYTAKVIWLLAELYNWTGREDFKQALIDKLERNLIPGVLMDQDKDGLVDGISQNIAFSDLSPVAQTPGRMWDGHNALPWYHSMNAWAMLEAYVAFRDRGDVALADTYKPYVIAMLDNLATEFVSLGPSDTRKTAYTDVPFSLLLGIWKLAQYENEAHPLWEDAVWAIWNTGIFETLGHRGINLPLYLLIKTETPYEPLFLRD